MLKEHVVSLPAKRKRAHRKVSRHSSRSRHKRQTSLTQLPPIAQIPRGDTPPSTTPSSRSRISVTSIRSFPMENSIPESVEGMNNACVYPFVYIMCQYMVYNVQMDLHVHVYAQL